MKNTRFQKIPGHVAALALGFVVALGLPMNERAQTASKNRDNKADSATTAGDNLRADKTPRGVGADMDFERGDFMRDFTYKNYPKMWRDSSPGGAYRKTNIEWERTKQGAWFVEEQRNGAYAVVGGIAVRDRESIERGLVILRWAFAQQKADGSWNCPDAYHSTSLFLAAAARAMLHLQNSRYAKDYANELTTMKAALHRAARWMTRPEVEAAGIENESPYTHRFYAMALALGQTGVLNNDKALIEKAHRFAREGLKRQHPSGYNPEKGGYDTSYNAAGLMLAAQFYLNVADDSIRPEILEMYRKSIAWQLARIGSDGIVETAGNTRVGAESTEITRNNAKKRVNIGDVTRALAYWSYFTGDKSPERLAEKVATVKQPN